MIVVTYDRDSQEYTDGANVKYWQFKRSDSVLYSQIGGVEYSAEFSSSQMLRRGSLVKSDGIIYRIERVLGGLVGAYRYLLREDGLDD